MGSHKRTKNKKKMFNSDIIKEINKRLFISFGSNKTLIVYDQYFNEIVKFISKNYINSICEIYDKYISKIMICLETGPSLINFNLNSKKFKFQDFSIPKTNFDFCLEISEDNYLLFGLGNNYHYINLLNKENKNKIKRKLFI